MDTCSDLNAIKMNDKNLVATLIIVHKVQPTLSEIASLKQYRKVLGHYPSYLICPKGLDVSAYKTIFPKIKIDYIPSKWQKTYESFARLKIDPFIYKRYRRYKYVLFYELDAWVFRDELKNWCNKNYDYIGAPWFKETNEEENLEKAFVGVGNGGLSLRKTSSLLKVLNSFSYVYTYKECFVYLNKNKNLSRLSRTVSLLKNFTIANNTFWLFNNFKSGEDVFWGLYISRKFDWFSIPNYNEALKFSFEKRCKESLKHLNGQLPFGCHKWENENEISFWKDYIK